MKAISRLPVEVPRAQRAEEAAQRLRELADELEQDSSVRGILVIIDSSSSEADRFRTINTGVLKASRERAVWALLRVKHWLVSAGT